MNHLDASFIHNLLAKNISFCLYRFPFEDDNHLALDKEMLPNGSEKSFWIAPFAEASSAKNILLSCVSKGDIEVMSQHLSALPDRPLNWNQLPQQISKESYLSNINNFLNGIHEGTIRKAILSRVRKVAKPGNFDPYEVFEKLCTQYPKTFVHLVYHKEEGMWIGATPELLLSSDGDYYTTMALAGTQAANKGEHYVWGAKEKEEHQMVCHHIESVFSHHDCILMVKNGPKTVEAGPVVHLQTNYEFYQRSRIDLKELLKDLHPTPAVGGWPAQPGTNFILEHEGYDRKYYCGFLGVTNFENKARLFISLRCMQIGENEIAIYCGGGITADSDPESEWEETVQKSRTMLDILKEMKENEVVR